jgi:hypothetical protein
MTKFLTLFLRETMFRLTHAQSADYVPFVRRSDCHTSPCRDKQIHLTMEWETKISESILHTDTF